MAGGILLASCRLAVNGLEVVPREGGAPVDAHVTDAADGGAQDVQAGDAPDALTTVASPEFAWYRLDETSGTVAHDATNNHYDVTNLLGVTWGQGASFDGTGGGGYVLVGQGIRQAPVSFTAWLAPDSRIDLTATTHGINPFPPNAASGDVPGSYGFGIGLDVWSGGSALGVENVGYDFSNVGGTQFMVAVEYFVAATIGATMAEVYVDGQPVGQGPTKTPGTTPGTVLSLGFHNTDPLYGTKRFYAGRMRDVRVFKRVLSSAEVATLYSEGPAK